MGNELANHGEILLYSDDSGKEFIDVVFKDETFWLTQKGMAELFDVKVPAISKHLKNIFLDEELDEAMVVSKMEITTPHGAIEGKNQTNEANFYNLDAIIAVGYRVNSKKATRFRQWAAKTLRGVISDDGIKSVYCPVVESCVDGATCLEMTLVADREIKATALPDNIVWNKTQRNKCLHCKRHDELR